MPTDLDLNEEKDVHLDGANDLATTSGTQQLLQSVAIDVMDEISEMVAGRITARNIGFIEERITRGFNEDPQIDSIRDVSIEEFNRQTGVLTITAHVIEDEDFEFTLNT